jgi:FkbM family methyltransferase
LKTIMLGVGASHIQKVKMKDGSVLLLDLRANTEAPSFITGEYESELQAILFRLLRQNFTTLDIGANIGFYTIGICQNMKRRNISGHIVSFEPFHQNYEHLCRNIEINGFDDMVTTLEIGLSNEDRAANVVLRDDRAGAVTGDTSIAISEDFDSGHGQAPVRLVRFDDVWPALEKDVPPIDLVKIDVEGHEDLCLEGARTVFLKARPTIMIEVAKVYYLARGVDFNTRYLAALPSNYLIFRRAGRWSGLAPGMWEQIPSFAYCNDEVDNVFLIPEEKVALPGYEIFVRREAHRRRWGC